MQQFALFFCRGDHVSHQRGWFRSVVPEGVQTDQRDGRELLRRTCGEGIFPTTGRFHVKVHTYDMDRNFPQRLFFSCYVIFTKMFKCIS